MSIGYANISSSVQDHRQKFEIIIRFWKNKREQKNQQKGSLKCLKRTASEVKVLLKSSAPEVMTSSEASSSEVEDHQKLKIIRKKMRDLKLQRLFNGFNIV